MIRHILWDLDATLLDFPAAERHSLCTCFSAFGFGECTEAQIALYSAVNRRHWERLERGEITREEVMTGRFREFFAAEGLICRDIQAFCRAYEYHLGDTVVYCEDSYELVKRLRGKVKQYIVTNGSLAVQRRRLERSGFGALVDGCFTSEELGAEKPDPAFFEAVWKRLAPDARDRSVLVGDSLTSDILGGNRAGIVTIWYNPSGQPNRTAARPDYEIRSLREVEELVDSLYPTEAR